ncbi:MAG: Ppx/GppA family phosphatase, partial [Novosphingobium sp.]
MAENHPSAMREETSNGPGDQDTATGDATPDKSSSRPGGQTSTPVPRPVAQWGSLPFHRQAFAAIDLGTNNCRLLIARPQGDNFLVIDAVSRVVRLGEGLAQSGRLSDAAMDRALG